MRRDERTPVRRHRGAQPVACGHAFRHLAGIWRRRRSIEADRLAEFRGAYVLDGPHHVGHLVAQELHPLHRWRLHRRCQRRREEEPLLIGHVAREAKHRERRPTAIVVGVGGACQNLIAEHVGDEQSEDPAEAADRQLQRHETPVVAVEQQELGDEELRHVAGRDVQRAEVCLAVFHFPESRARHAVEPNRGRQKRERGHRSYRSGREVARDIERVPIEIAAAMRVRRKAQVAAATPSGEAVFEPVRLPRLVFGRRCRVDAIEPVHERGRCVHEVGLLGRGQAVEPVDRRRVRPVADARDQPGRVEQESSAHLEQRPRIVRIDTGDASLVIE